MSVVIPASNEERNIAWVLERLSPEHEVILIDGGSSDATIEVARAARPGLIVRSDHAFGKGDALRTGFNTASGQIIVMLDADGSMDPGEIPRFVDAIVAGHDVVKGSRVLPGGGSGDLSWPRATGNSALCALVNRLYGARFTDLCYGFFAFRRECLPLLKLATDGFEIETEIVVCSLKAGLRITEVPSYEYPRRYGDSHLNAMRDGTRVLFTLLRRRVSRYPRRLNNPWTPEAPAIAPPSRAPAQADPDAPAGDRGGREAASRSRPR